MKKPIKILLLILLFLAVAVGAVLGYRWFSGRETPAPLATEGQTYLTTSPLSAEGYSDVAEEEKDNLASDSSIEPVTAWPFSDRKSESKFKAKESVGYTKPSAAKRRAAPKKGASDKPHASGNSASDSDSKKTSKKSSSSKAGDAKSFLQKLESSAAKRKNGHPVVVDSDGISTEYQKFAIADLNGDGKDELFLYAVRTKGDEFYGYTYTVYDSSLKHARTTMVIDEFKKVTFYQSGAYEITEGKFGFVSDSVAESFGVKNKNSILGFDATASPYLRYTTNGPYIDSPSEISASAYQSQLAKLRSGGKVTVNVHDFTASNVSNL